RGREGEPRGHPADPIQRRAQEGRVCRGGRLPLRPRDLGLPDAHRERELQDRLLRRRAAARSAARDRDAVPRGGLMRRILIAAGSMLWFGLVFLVGLRLTFPSAAVVERLRYEVERGSDGEFALQLGRVVPAI